MSLGGIEGMLSVSSQHGPKSLVIPPKRIQMSRQTPWRPQNPKAVIVARPTKWGNPFAVGIPVAVKIYPSLVSVPVLEADVRPRDRAEAVRLFSYLFREPRPFSIPNLHMSIADVIAQLGGHDLACWCPLNEPCHADVLLEIANPIKPEGLIP